MKRPSQSAPEYSLLLKKTCQGKCITRIPLKLGVKKTVLVIAFRIALTLYVIIWFGRQVTDCVKKRQFLGVVGFKSSTMTAYCIGS